MKSALFTALLLVLSSPAGDKEKLRDAMGDTGLAGTWIYDELNNQVYPDGVQVELSSGYHHVSLNNFLAVYKVAELNGVALQEEFAA